MAIFAELVAEQAQEAAAVYDGPRWCWLAERWSRHVAPFLAPSLGALEGDPVIDVSGVPTCDAVMRRWLGLPGPENAAKRKVALELTDALHGFEMERAARPPQVTYSLPVGAAPAAEGSGPAVLPAPTVHPDHPGLIETTHQVRQYVKGQLGR